MAICYITHPLLLNPRDSFQRDPGTRRMEACARPCSPQSKNTIGNDSSKESCLRVIHHVRGVIQMSIPPSYDPWPLRAKVHCPLGRESNVQGPLGWNLRPASGKVTCSEPTRCSEYLEAGLPPGLGCFDHPIAVCFIQNSPTIWFLSLELSHLNPRIA